MKKYLFLFQALKMYSLINVDNFYKRIVNFINVAMLQLGWTVSLKRWLNSITNIVIPSGIYQQLY